MGALGAMRRLTTGQPAIRPRPVAVRRRWATTAAVAVLAALGATASPVAGADPATPPPPAFTLIPSSTPCVAGTCTLTVTYDTTALRDPVVVGVTWDAADGRAADPLVDELQTCAPTEPVPCTFTSPVLRSAGTQVVALRVIAPGDDDGPVATQSLAAVAPIGGVGGPGASPLRPDLCANLPDGVQCRPGGGARTPGGGEKVSHRGWPAITGIVWKVLDGTGHRKQGGRDNDELLGHHGDDALLGGPGRDVLWGDWDPKDNTARQRDLLDGGPGDDHLYPSHGASVVQGGAGNDRVWAYYGRGTIDCGPGRDVARIRLHSAFRVRNCEVIQHFCGHGADGRGGCLKPSVRAAVERPRLSPLAGGRPARRFA